MKSIKPAVEELDTSRHVGDLILLIHFVVIVTFLKRPIVKHIFINKVNAKDLNK